MINKPKILFLVPLPPPLHGASMQSQMIVHSPYLNRKFNIRVIPLRFTSTIAEIGRFSLLKIVKMTLLAGYLLFKVPIFRPQLVYYVITHRGYSFYRDCFFVFIIKLFRKKIVFHHRNKGASAYGGGRIKRYLRKKVFSNTYSIVLSPLLVYDVEPFVPKEMIYVVPNGIPDVEMPKQEHAGSTPTILFLSNMIAEKGVFVLLEALAHLKHKKIPFKGIFTGAWSYNITEAVFRERVYELGLENHIEYKPPVYDSEKLKLLAGSDIFVFPTLHESFGNVVLEAMRASIPTVASDEGSLPFIITHGETGLICRKGDSQDLANKIEKLLKSKKLGARIGKNGRRRFLDHFTFNKFEHNFNLALKSILQKEAQKFKGRRRNNSDVNKIL